MHSELCSMKSHQNDVNIVIECLVAEAVIDAETFAVEEWTLFVMQRYAWLSLCLVMSSTSVALCLSVCLSVCCMPLSNSRTERPRCPKLAGWKPITRVTCELIYNSKSQRSRSPGRLMLSQTMHNTQVGDIRIFLKLACWIVHSFLNVSDVSSDGNEAAMKFLPAFLNVAYGRFTCCNVTCFLSSVIATMSCVVVTVSWT